MSRNTRPKRNITTVTPLGGHNEATKENRDPKGLNKHVQVDFYSVLGEPAAVRSFECVWDFSETMYNCFNECCYKLATCCCGCFFAIHWALELVPVMFYHVWFITPFLNLVKLVCGFWCRSVCFVCARAWVAPLMNAIAPIFSYCGDGLKKRPDSPTLYPKSNWRRPKPAPKASVAPVVAKVKNTPLPEKKEFHDYNKEKIAKSISRQLRLY